MAFVDIPGLVIPPAALKLPRAKAVALALKSGRLPYATAVECRVATGDDGAIAETVVVDVEVERPQEPVNLILRHERIAMVFAAADDAHPEVLALREDFPRVAHTNIRATEIPRSLCLYDQPWAEVAMRWTAPEYIQTIQRWLAQTASGTLHAPDQPVEPFLAADAAKVLLPFDLFNGKADGEAVEVAAGWLVRNKTVLVTREPEADHHTHFLALAFTAPPQTHGAIRHMPLTLQELVRLLDPVGVPLLARLRERLPRWKAEKAVAKQLLLIIRFPLVRDEGGSVETVDTWAFATTSTIEEIGIDLDVWGNTSSGYGQVLSGAAVRSGESTKLLPLSPVLDLTREAAARSSGVAPDSRRTVAVGAGALGSQLVRLLAQAGFGTWCLIDQDVLLPHNLARHALGPGAIGHLKAHGLATEVHSLFGDAGPTSWFVADLLRPGDNATQINESLAEAELILDLAASTPVSRHLAHVPDCSGRRIAVFLNPSGTDLVLLAEDAKRTITLDCLEMQYYRGVVEVKKLGGHMKAPPSRLRYARSCRDVTTLIPNHLVAMHAGIGAGAVRDVIASEAAAIRVWRADPLTGAVQYIRIPVCGAWRKTIGDWMLVIDDGLLTRMDTLRTAKLPNETGGILIGAYDMTRGIMYVVDLLPSPPDSKEWPTLYIRGSHGLQRQLAAIKTATAEQLEYVGEWHSHPDGCTCLPSTDDARVFSWLGKQMGDAGLPPLMAIAGERRTSAWYLEATDESSGWQLGPRSGSTSSRRRRAPA